MRKFLLYQGRLILAVLCMSVGVFFAFDQALCGEITVRVAVEKQEVYVGETFLLQIQVEGNDAPLEPDLSTLDGFTVQPRGGQQNNSESISIVNGRTSRVSRRGFVFSFSLTPNRAGVLSIPAIAVTAAGETYLTSPLTIRARQPEESDDFKLHLSLSRDACYVNQQVVLTVTWYVGKDVKDFDFNLPLLADKRFVFADMPADVQAGGREQIVIPLATGRVTGWKGRQTLDGIDYLAVTFSKIMIPQESGQLQLDRGTVSCRAVVGYKQGGGRSPFDEFFNNDFFGRSRNEVVQTFITPSNQVSLQVRPLPAEGRPAAFSGLVGKYRLTTEADPVTVNVGDPITLRISVAGPPYLGNVPPPSLLEHDELSRDFKIPAEMAPGEEKGAVKRFMQTIRANHSEVKEIPALMLDYFDPESGRYEVARAAAIPLTVNATRVVTAEDAEGGGDTLAFGRKVKGLEQGIVYNYDDPSVLQNQEFGLAAWSFSPGWLVLLLAPPTLFLLLLVPGIVDSRRRRGSKAMAVKKAYSQLVVAFDEVGTGVSNQQANLPIVAQRLLDAIRRYLGLRLGIASAALTYMDVEERLLAAGINRNSLLDLKKVIDWCEVQHYAGDGVTNGEMIDVGAIVRAGRDACEVIDGILPGLRQQG